MVTPFVLKKHPRAVVLGSGDPCHSWHLGQFSWLLPSTLRCSPVHQVAHPTERPASATPQTEWTSGCRLKVLTIMMHQLWFLCRSFLMRTSASWDKVCGLFVLVSPVPSQSRWQNTFVVGTLLCVLVHVTWVLPLTFTFLHDNVLEIEGNSFFYFVSETVGHSFIYFLLFFKMFFGCTAQHMESSSPTRNRNPCPLHWKHRVLTIGLPRKSPDILLK